MAYVTFAIVGLFFCLNMPRFVLGSFEVSNTWLILRCLENKVKYLSPLTFYRWDCISRLLMVVNSSINFLIYCTGSDQFKVSAVLPTHWIHFKSKDILWPWLLRFVMVWYKLQISRVIYLMKCRSIWGLWN